MSSDDLSIAVSLVIAGVAALVLRKIFSARTAKMRDLTDSARRRVWAQSNEELRSIDSRVLGQVCRLKGSAKVELGDIATILGEDEGYIGLSAERLSQERLIMPEGLKGLAAVFGIWAAVNLYAYDRVFPTPKGRSRHRNQRESIGDLVMGDKFSNIGAGATIINRSLLTNALNRVVLAGDEEAAASLKVLAEHVQKSGNTMAVENFEGLLEEVERTVPRQSRMSAFWDGLVKVLPSVTQLGEATERVVKLMSQ